MAARAIASATVSFGLVSIPVKLFSSTESSHTIRFNQIHSKDGARVKQQLISSTSGEPVPRDEIVKGYEFAKGQYVLFSPEELKAIEAAATQTIDITEFIPAGRIDRALMEKVYYLGPDKGGARAYRLLSAALRETGRHAIAKYAARGKQYLVVVRPQDEGLVLEQLRYPQELRAFEDIPVDEAQVKDDELKLAIALIEQAASEQFEPADYRDEVRERVLEMIERKVQGEDISLTPSEQPQAKIIDIMDALKASLAASGEDTTKRKPAKRASAKTPRKKATTRKKSAAKK